MKKIVSFALVLLMAFTFCFVAIPEKAEAGEITSLVISAKPASLLTGGTVKLSGSVTVGDNITDAVLKVGGSKVQTLGDLTPGEWPISGEFKVSTEELGTNIPVVLSYTYEEETKTYTSSLQVGKEEATINVVAEAAVDREIAAMNSQVVFTFAVENKSNVDIEDCTIKASSLNNGKSVCSSFDVKTGKSKMITYTGTIMKSISVTPVLTFTAAGTQKSVNMNTLEIMMSNASIAITASPETLSLDAETAGEVTLTIQNSGNIEMNNISVKDQNGNLVALPTTSLAAGAYMTATATLDLAESTQMIYTVSAIGADSQTYTASSNIVDVTLIEPADETDYSELLVLEIIKDESALAETGKGKITLRLHNNSETAFTNVVISEASMGNIDTLASMSPGTRELVLEQEINEDVRYAFKVTATDPNGMPIELEEQEVTFTVEQEEENSGGFNVLLLILIIIAVLIIATGVVLFVLYKKDKDKKAQAANIEEEEYNMRKPQTVSRAGKAASDARAEHNENTRRRAEYAMRDAARGTAVGAAAAAKKPAPQEEPEDDYFEEYSPAEATGKTVAAPEETLEEITIPASSKKPSFTRLSKDDLDDRSSF